MSAPLFHPLYNGSLGHVWAGRFLRLAEHVSTWSKDPSTKVGAVLANELKQVVGLGYNGFPRGVDDDPERMKERAIKYPMTVHAEANALLNATGAARRAHLHTTMFPCSECAKLIIQAGVQSVVTPRPIARDPWAADSAIALQMLQEAGVEIGYANFFSDGVLDLVRVPRPGEPPWEAG